MATTTPPGAAAGGPARPPAPQDRGASPRGPVTLARAAAIGGLVIVLAAVLYLLLSGGESTEYHLMFASADELVRGNEVEVGGVPVGTVKEIQLTHDYKARITIEVSSPIAPLHQGTTAQIRVPSLGSVAGRYISLAPGPNNSPALPAGATLPARDTKVAVNLEQLFDALNPRTRRGLQQFLQGSATQYKGVEHDVNVSTEYFSPALRATSHVFDELVRDEHAFSSFLVESQRALSTLAAHRAQISGLVENGARTLEAVGPQSKSLEVALKRLPGALHEGNRLFAGLPSTLTALRRLLNAAKPSAPQLAPFFERLQSLLANGTEPLHQLSVAIDKPGPNNDLTDLALALPGLANTLKTASPDAVRAENESVPVTAFFGPYAPDLEGLFHNFGQDAGYYDAAGHYDRVTPDFLDFKLTEGKLVPIEPSEALNGLTSGQNRRCPGSGTQPAEDGSSPFTDEGKLGCDPTQVPR